MWATPPGYITEATQRAGLVSQVGRAAATSARAQAAAATEMQEIVDLGYVIVGSPDEVVAQLTEVATTLNVGHLMLLLQFGNMGKELAKYNTKLFAEAVDAAASGAVPGVGGQLVAAADGRRAARHGAGVRSGPGGGVDRRRPAAWHNVLPLPLREGGGRRGSAGTMHGAC